MSLQTPLVIYHLKVSYQVAKVVLAQKRIDGTRLVLVYIEDIIAHTEIVDYLQKADLSCFL